MSTHGMESTRVFLALVLGCVLAGALIQPVHAEPLLDQSFLGGIGSTSGESDIAQTFTVGIAGTLSRVEVRILGSAAVTVEIRPTTSSGLPLLSNDSADQLARVTLMPASPLTFSLASVDLSPFGISVEPGDMLAIVLRSSGIMNWGVAIDEDATYTRGQAFLKEDDEWKTFNQAFSGAFFEADYQFKTFVEPLPDTLRVTVDIKPGERQNSINPKSKGVIPVAILTTPGFDATDIDPASVKLGPEGSMEAHGKGHFEDVDGDGDLDLLLHFRMQATGIVCGQISASLTGETLDGQAIEGVDSIRTVGCR